MDANLSPVEHARIIDRDGEEVMRTERAIGGGVHLCFEWRGGAYIDVGRLGADHPVEVINVYDYAAGVVELDREKGTFDRKVDEWIEEYGKQDLIRDVTHNW